MPSLTRASGVDIHWEEQGEGPLVLFVHHFSAYPDVHRDLLDDLARDHRVVTYDPRGSGRSSRQGPYDLETDMGDLAALARELGGGAVAVGLGDGRDRATRIAAAAPDLIRAVVGCGASPVGRSMGAIEGPGASRPVLDAIVDLLNTNFRTALREMLQLTNPGMTEDALRERLDATVAYSSPEAITVRSRWFLRDDTVSAARTIGDRLWIAYWESTWAPGDQAVRVRELLPEAHVCPIREGPITEPGLTADVVRQAVRSAAAGGP